MFGDMGDTLFLFWNGGGSDGVSGANVVAATPIHLTTKTTSSLVEC